MALTQFAESFSLFSQVDVQEALADAQLLGSKHHAAFVFPPAVSTLRQVRPPATEGEAAALSRFVGELQSSGHVVQPCGSVPGLPDCWVIHPSHPHPAQRDGMAFAPCAKAADDGTEDGPPEDSAAVVVDVGCGEAVLRGSDVFAPGIVAFSKDFKEGDPVRIFVALPKGKGTSLPFLKNTFLTDTELQTLCVQLSTKMPHACAVASMARTAVVRGEKGTAVRVMGSTGFGHPGLGNLAVPLPSLLFLQNHSSMVPAELLAPEPHHAVLDMCAAPGGKASHLLSAVSRTARKRPGDQPLDTVLRHGGFSMTCCERSPSRARQLRSLLELHHGAALVDGFVQIVPKDVNKLTSVPTYDRILLDPPCSGTGLRPRLRPHDHTMDFITVAADYQRKLLRSAAAMLKPTGRLTYSTCSLTVLENEGNVAWALAEGGLRVVASDTDHPIVVAFDRLARRRHHFDSVPADHAAWCWTFGPKQSSTQPLLDSVGFFVALLELAA